MRATGGTITIDGAYTVHTFTSGGSFQIVDGQGELQYLVAGAGGGGGGPSGRGGGGGGGGVNIGTKSNPSIGTYSVTVGSGGAGSTSASTRGQNGNNSVFDDVTSLGGGGGGTGPDVAGSRDGASGGSGGGGGDYAGAGTGGAGTVGQGNTGGNGLESAPAYGAGGGGGAGANGENGTSAKGGNGGDGVQSSISGTSQYYGGGGGGAAASGSTAGTGGQGGGGNGTGASGATAGAANTGAGGGGGCDSVLSNGAAGGSGIVILRYLTETTEATTTYRSWFFSGWKFRKKVTINHTKVSGSTPLINFPVLINVSDPNIRNNAQATGIDIVVTDANHKLLDFELESYTQATGQVVMWVRVPSLSPSVDTILYLYYGNTNNTSLSNPVGVWSRDTFKKVSHLQQDPSGVAPQITDSTGRYSGVTQNMTSGASVAAKIGKGLTFDGSDDGITYPSIDFGLKGSISFIAKKNTANAELVNRCIFDSSSANRYILYKRATTDNSHGWYINGTAILDGVGTLVDLLKINEDALIHLTWDNSLSSQKQKVYKNGSLFATANVTITAGTPSNVYLARRFSNQEFYGGIIDEFRLWNTAISADWATTEANNLLTSNTFYTIGVQEINYITQKYYIYRIYDQESYVTTWTDDVLSEPKFRSTINGGPGELLIKLGRSFDDFGEDDDVKLNNRVECYVVDQDSPNGLLFYSGYISGYEPIVDKEDEQIEITVLGYVAELQRMIVRDASGNTTLTYNSYDPAQILRDIIDKLAVLGCHLRYTATSIQNTNTTVSYAFNTNTGKECLDKIIELCPEGWYYRIDPDNTIVLKPKNILSDHQFTLGLDVESLGTFRRVEDLVNRVLFVGGGSPALFRKYENTGSQGTYGLYEIKMVDQRVTVAATAQIISERIITARKDPEIRSRFLIVDNNGPGQRGYDIESIKPGMTLKVKNLRESVQTISLWDVTFWDEDVWDQTLTTSAADVIQILSTEYTPDSIRIEASSRLPQISKRIEDIQRNLEVTQMVNNPTSPT